MALELLCGLSQRGWGGSLAGLGYQSKAKHKVKQV